MELRLRVLSSQERLEPSVRRVLSLIAVAPDPQGSGVGILAVLEWLRLDSNGERKGCDVPVFSNEAGEPLKTFKKAWVVAVLKATA